MAVEPPMTRSNALTTQPLSTDTSGIVRCARVGCHKPFKARRHWQRYCGNACRTKSWMDEHPRVRRERDSTSLSRQSVEPERALAE